MNRRNLLVTIGGAAALGPLAAAAQPAAKVSRIGYLGLALAAGDPRPREAFLKGLHDLGYNESRNIVIEYRDAAGKPERFSVLAAELVALEVEVIVATGGTAGARPRSRPQQSFRLSFRLSGIQWRKGSSPAWLGRAAMSRGCPPSPPRWSASRCELLRRPVPGASAPAFLLKRMPCQNAPKRLE